MLLPGQTYQLGGHKNLQRCEFIKENIDMSVLVVLLLSICSIVLVVKIGLDLLSKGAIALRVLLIFCLWFS